MNSGPGLHLLLGQQEGYGTSDKERILLSNQILEGWLFASKNSLHPSFQLIKALL